MKKNLALRPSLWRSFLFYLGKEDLEKYLFTYSVLVK